jgi:hypothetical protein
MQSINITEMSIVGTAAWVSFVFNIYWRMKLYAVRKEMQAIRLIKRSTNLAGIRSIELLLWAIPAFLFFWCKNRTHNILLIKVGFAWATIVLIIFWVVNS